MDFFRDGIVTIDQERTKPRLATLRALMKLVIVVLFAISAAALMSGSRIARNSLWLVVQTCAANHDLTGAPFPCLSVTPSSDARDGYVVLRAPVDADTIWSPTRKVVGLEDPALRGPKATGYFLDAWNSRAFAPGLGGGRAVRTVVLAINSASARSQDQLHIHMGCAAPRAERWAADAMSRLSDDRWTPIDARVSGRQLWGRRVIHDDLEHFNPFVLTEELASANAMPLSNILIAVIGIRSDDDRYHFLVAAGESDEFDVKRLISRGC
jgi:CDP-diacylglycerol pyrophosphatase